MEEKSITEELHEDQIKNEREEDSIENKDKEYWSTKYSLYDYFKAHPTVIIAIVSGFAAVLTYCVRIIDYQTAVSVLRYYSLSSSLYEPNQDSVLASFGCSIVIIILYIVLYSKMYDIFHNYFINIRPIRYNNILYRENKRLKHKNKKLLRKMKSAVDERKKLMEESLSKGVMVNQEFVQNTQETDTYVQQEEEKYRNSEAKEEFESQMRETRSEHSKLLGIRRVVIQLIVPSIVLWIVSASRAFGNNTNDRYALYISSAIIVVFIIIVSCILGRFTTSDYPTKKSVLNDETGNYFKKIIEEKPRYPTLYRLTDDGIKQFFPNRTIISITMMSVFAIAMFIITSGFLYPLLMRITSTKPQTQAIVYIEEEPYVMVYQKGSQFYLEGAIIDGDHLTIDTSNRRCVETDDIQAKVMRFNQVIVLKTEGND